MPRICAAFRNGIRCTKKDFHVGLCSFDDEEVSACRRIDRPDITLPREVAIRSAGRWNNNAGLQRDALEMRKKVCEVADGEDQGEDGEVEEAEGMQEESVSESDGIRLHLSLKSATGYFGVGNAPLGARGPYIARGRAQGKQVTIGFYQTAVEAAVAYAKFVEPKSETGGGSCDGSQSEEEGELLVALPPASTCTDGSLFTSTATAPAASTASTASSASASASAAVAAAAEEGLELLRADNSSGYRGVALLDNGVYIARHMNRTIGKFDAAEEAALAYARSVRETAEAAAVTASIARDSTDAAAATTTDNATTTTAGIAAATGTVEPALRSKRERSTKSERAVIFSRADEFQRFARALMKQRVRVLWEAEETWYGAARMHHTVHHCPTRGLHLYLTSGSPMLLTCAACVCCVSTVHAAALLLMPCVAQVRWRRA